MNYLTVKELIKSLQEEDPSAFVALDRGSHITLMLDEGYMQPDSYMKKEPRDQSDFLLKDEIKPSEKNKYIKVLILGA